MKRFKEGIRPSDNDYDFDYSHDEPNDILTLKFPDQGLRKRRVTGLELFYFYKASKTTHTKIKTDFLVWAKQSSNARVEIQNFVQRALVSLNHYRNLNYYDIVIFPPSSSYLLKRIEKFLRERHVGILFSSELLVKDSSNIDYSELEEMLQKDISPGFRKYIEGALKVIKRSGTLQIKKIPKPFVKFVHNFIVPNPEIKRIRNFIEDSKVLVIDDYCFSGTTLKEVNLQLSKFNPKLINNFVLISR